MYGKSQWLVTWYVWHRWSLSSCCVCAVISTVQAYSEELAMVAQNYALMCSAAHSDRNERAQAAPSFSTVGENIFATFHSSLTINYTSYIVDSWGLDEKRYYSYELNSCEPGRVCGHYTQVKSLRYRISG